MDADLSKVRQEGSSSPRQRKCLPGSAETRAESTQRECVLHGKGLAEPGLGGLGGLEALNLVLWQMRSMVMGVAGPGERGAERVYVCCCAGVCGLGPENKGTGRRSRVSMVLSAQCSFSFK